LQHDCLANPSVVCAVHLLSLKRRTADEERIARGADFSQWYTEGTGLGERYCFAFGHRFQPCFARSTSVPLFQDAAPIGPNIA
jgi:hypothetical protein